MEKKDNQLPQKENALFKQIVKFYETKQYKKGLKASEQILKRFPNHGETLAMKGLTLNCMSADKKGEAYSLVKEGIKYDMKSHVCWHVYGLLYRSDRDYKQAIKGYTQALKLDAGNLQILRDLSLLQIHTRDLKGYLKTRYELLQLKPVHRTNWVAYAVANHLLKKNGTATKVIEAYQKLDEKDPKYETSEMCMYANLIIEETGNIQGALDHIDANFDDVIVDKLGAREKRASFLLQLGRAEDAKEAYMSLIDRNVENLNYHTGLRKAYDLDTGDIAIEAQAELVDIYETIQQRHPRANAPRRIPLDFCSGERFTKAADSYIRRKLRSGIPSLYSDLLPLYTNPEKVAALETLEESMLAALEETNKFAPSELEPEPKEESPMVIMWLWKLLANHYERTGQPLKAIESIDKAINHTPSCVELYLCKGRIYKHHGNTKAAAACLEKARSMDLADRYLNTRSTVYFMRDDQIERAEKTVVLFTKEGDQVNNLHEMQCMWFAIECGNAHLRKHNYGLALKKLTAVDKHFTDFCEDQFDFHSYCLRKMTLRSYYAMLNNADRIRNSKNFLKAAQAVITCYLALHKTPALAAPADEFAGMDDKAKKKAKAKKAKAEAKKAEEEAKALKAKGGKKGAAPAAVDSKSEKKKKDEDTDPLGNKLLEKNPLEECHRYIQNLQQYQPGVLLTHILAYDVYKQMEKPLGMIKSLRSAACIDAASPELHWRMCEFFHGVAAGSVKLSTIAQDVVTELAKDVELLGEKSVEEFNAIYTAANVGSGPARVAGAKGLLAMGAAAADVMAHLTDLTGSGLTIKLCQEVVVMLEDLDASAVAPYKAKCAEKFPLSTVFSPHLLEQEELFAPELQYRDKPAEDKEGT